MREIALQIAGQEIIVRSDEDEAYLAKLAAYVETKIDQLTQNGRGVTTLTVALTAALTLADELDKSRSGGDTVGATLDSLIGRLESEIQAFDA